jgi:hypothetical protein
MQFSIQVCITWFKNLGKGKVEWTKGLCSYKIITTKVKQTNENKVCLQTGNVLASL